METLRLLANSCKHDPYASPDNKLLDHLGLQKHGATYAPLSESRAVKEALGKWLGLASDADYCDITEDLAARATNFIQAVKNSTSNLSGIKRGSLSLRWQDLAR